MIAENLPSYIAICGNPKSGKTTAQKILQDELGYQPVDDGHVLREFAVEKLGLSWDDVQTQDGKKRITKILGKDWQNRILLGELGNRFEEMFGEHIMPFIATRSLDPAGLYSFGSVRKSQGHFYREAGGIVIEIENPLAPPSDNAFDKYDEDAINFTVVNDGQILFPGDEASSLARFRHRLLDCIRQAAGV